jgi:hypothetical protein
MTNTGVRRSKYYPRTNEIPGGRADAIATRAKFRKVGESEDV